MGIVCESCKVNDAYYDDTNDGTARDATGARFLCMGCISRAMHAIVMRDAIIRLINDDDELRETLSIMIDVDTYNYAQHIPYVDFATSAHDHIVGHADDVREQLRSTFDSIVNMLSVENFARSSRRRIHT